MARQDDTALSSQMAAAQEQLYQRRQQRRQERLTQRLPVHTDTHGRSLLPPAEPIAKPDYRCGWQSECLTRNLLASQARQVARRQAQDALLLTWLRHQTTASAVTSSTEAQAKTTPETDSFTLHPDLAVAMLQKNVSAPGRLWLLLRHIDEEGRGWVNLEYARQQLSGPQASLRLCSWRQLRNLLAQGEGVFWQRDEHGSSTNRIWLRSPAKVAAALGLARLDRKPVKVSFAILLETIGTVRAHFYASFHSGRDSERPIARQTIVDITGVARRTQHQYEKRAGIKRQHNWTIDRSYSQEEMQECAWRQGRAVFRLQDVQGRMGAPGDSYIAWQMPNSYIGPHKLQTNARKKRINQKLADLLNKGITGNGEKKVEEPVIEITGSQIRYYEHGRAAVRAFNRNATRDHYWRTATAYGRNRVWHLLRT